MVWNLCTSCAANRQLTESVKSGENAVSMIGLAVSCVCPAQDCKALPRNAGAVDRPNFVERLPAQP